MEKARGIVGIFLLRISLFFSRKKERDVKFFDFKSLDFPADKSSTGKTDCFTFSVKYATFYLIARNMCTSVKANAVFFYSRVLIGLHVRQLRRAPRRAVITVSCFATVDSSLPMHVFIPASGCDEKVHILLAGDFKQIRENRSIHRMNRTLHCHDVFSLLFEDTKKLS